MRHLAKLKNPIRDYAWGSTTAIASLLGRPPAAAPQAELWLGAHPSAPSEALTGGRWQRLDRLIEADPEAVLGRRVARRFGAALPFLLKVLAADRPLSVQAHPDRRQAAAGFAREQARGLPLAAPARNYRDRNHKPELLYALSRFWVMRGFRPRAEMLALLDTLALEEVLPATAALRAGDDGLEPFLRAYLNADAAAVERLLGTLVAAAAARAGEHPACAWVGRLAAAYPGDRGALMPLLLHTFQLAPGEAIFTGPGVLHAYLGGIGVELMASSDNVLRGCLTQKHVDVPALLEVVRFAAQGEGRLAAAGDGAARRFDTPAPELALAVIAIEGAPWRRDGGDGVEILLCTEGRGVARADGVDGALPFRRGEAILVPGCLGGYALHGTATVFRAFVPGAGR